MNQNTPTQRPPQSPQQRPPQGTRQGPQQRPSQGTQQRPPQGTQQRPPQGTQQRPPQRPQQRPPYAANAPAPKNGKSVMATVMVALLIVTALLLVIGLVTLSVVLVTISLDSSPTPSVDSGDGGDDTPPTTNPTPSTPSTSTIKQKTDITLPCATRAGNYSYSSSSATAITSAHGIESQAAALIDVTGGKAVATKNGDTQIYPASMTKVMTLLVACENAKSPTALLTVTEAMVAKYKSSYNPGEQGPSIATSWKAGDQITVEDALHLVIYESDTYACWLLAEYVAGSETAFVQMMNQKASSLGLRGTHFENCTGLYHDAHYTTCFDMATIMAAAMNNATAKKVLTAKDGYIVDVYVNDKKSSAFSMYSGWYTGRLEQYRYGAAAPYYAGNGSDIRLIAGKTGYETIPKYCFVTAGENDETGTLFVCVQVGASTPKISTDDSREIYQQFATY